jgi:hypothetical protein
MRQTYQETKHACDRRRRHLSSTHNEQPTAMSTGHRAAKTTPTRGRTFRCSTETRLARTSRREKCLLMGHCIIDTAFPHA